MKIKKNRVNCLDLKEQYITQISIKWYKAITKEMKKQTFFFYLPLSWFKKKKKVLLK